MKTRKLLYTISAALLISSCVTSTSFYQVYNVKPLDKSLTNIDELFFEDENCKISYDLWVNGGNIGFYFQNKTDNNIYVKLNKSSFILNGLAYDYFKNRTYTSSESKSASTSNTSTGSVGVTGINTSNYCVVDPTYKILKRLTKNLLTSIAVRNEY